MTRTVAITGATGTLGKAVADRFYIGDARYPEEEWSIYCMNHSDADVTDEFAVMAWFDIWSPIDAVVTCAGVSLVKPSLELTDEEWLRVHDVNFHGTRRAVIEGIRNGAKRIVVIGSIHGGTRTSYPQRAPYTASKSAIVGLTESLVVEFAPRGIAINAVCPGHLPVLMDGTGAGSELLEAARERTPTGKLATAEEVAEVVFWLCDSAPLALTGNTIVIDGGFVLNTYPL